MLAIPGAMAWYYSKQLEELCTQLIAQLQI